MSHVLSPAFVASKRPRKEKLKKFILEPGLILPPLAANQIKSGTVLDFTQIKETKDTEAQFITTSAILRCPSKQFFVCLLYNLEIVEVINNAG